MEFFYLEKTGEKRGPVNSAQLRALASNGIITPDTVIIAGGRNLPARKVKGLEFAAPVPPVVSEPEPEPYPIADPLPAPEPTPAPTPSTVFTHGGAYVDTSVSEGRPGTVNKARKRFVESGHWLESVCNFLNFLGGVEIIAGVIGCVLAVTGADHDNKDILIPAGVTALVSGIVSAVVAFYLSAIGRFLIAWSDLQNPGD